MADQENQKVDLDQIDETLIEEIVDINPEANPMEAPPPPDDGVHRTKLLPVQSSEVEVKKTNPKKGGEPVSYISFRISGAVQAEGTPDNNKRVFGRVNTLVFDGKSIMAQYVKVAKGDNAETRQFVKGLDNYVKLAKAFRDTLAGEPVIKIKTKWQASRKNPDGTYEVVLSGQKNFPPRKDGKGYEHVIFDKKTQTEIAAQAIIVDIFPDA